MIRRLLVPSLGGIVSVVLCAGVLATLTASDLSAASEADAAAAATPFSPPSGLDRAAPLPVDGAVGGAGLIEPRARPASWAVEVGGVVDAVHVTEGQRVAAGAPLVTLRSRAAVAERDAAVAELAAARAELGAASADAAGATARSASSDETARRTSALFARGVATADERDRAERTREADAEAARASGARVSQARARVAAADARRALAEERLAQLTLRAPADAEVLQVLVLPGEHLAPGAAAVVAGDTRVLTARIDLDERDAVRVAPGQRAVVRIEGLPGDLEATVLEVGRRVGRKNVRTDDPTDRLDARFVEVVLGLDAAPPVPVGIRVEGYVLPASS
jgi:HlyD family secretion protein